MENYKELLSTLYKEYAPEKVDQIDFYLDRYKGKEKQFYITQKAKYTNKKSVKDSKKILEEAMARINKRKEEAKAILQEEKDKKEKKEAIPVKEVKLDPKPIKEKPVVPIKKPVVKEEIKKEVIPAIIVEKETKPIEKKPEPIPVKKEKIEEREINPPILKREKTEEKIQVEQPKKEEADIVYTSAEQQRMEDLKSKKSDFETSRKSIQAEQAQEEEEKRKKRTPVFWYFGAAAVVFIALAILIYFSFLHQPTPQKEPNHVQKVVVDNKPVNTEDSKTTTIAKEEEKPEAEASKPQTEKKQVQNKPKKKEESKPEKKKAVTKSTADRLYASDINRPAIFVACFAVRQESLAQNKVASLKARNLDAHYYWIPDMGNNGNAFFKVVVGPFNSAPEAYPSLTKVQERINFDAYIIVVN